MRACCRRPQCRVCTAMACIAAVEARREQRNTRQSSAVSDAQKEALDGERSTAMRKPERYCALRPRGAGRSHVEMCTRYCARGWDKSRARDQVQRYFSVERKELRSRLEAVHAWMSGSAAKAHRSTRRSGSSTQRDAQSGHMFSAQKAAQVSSCMSTMPLHFEGDRTTGRLFSNPQAHCDVCGFSGCHVISPLKNQLHQY
jgi:hypothetical protein